MNLPQLTAALGRYKQQYTDDPVASLVRPLKTRVKQDEEAYAVKMFLDVDTVSIYFEVLDEHYSDDLLKKYNNFGNNSAASSQIYLTRETASLRYLLTSVFNDLLLGLKNNLMEDTELAGIIKRLIVSKLISIGTKTGEGQVNFEAFRCVESNQMSIIGLDKDKKKVVIKIFDVEKEYNFEDFLRMLLGVDSKKKRLLLIIPVIKLEKCEIILPVHKDYVDLVKKVNKIEAGQGANEPYSATGAERICYVCNKPKPDVKSDYTTKFSRDGINKIFITKKVNFNSAFTIPGYDDAYAFCRDCFNAMMSGEELIKRQFSGSIANERVFILPVGLLEDFDYENIKSIKNMADFAFRCRDAEEWLAFVDSEAVFGGHNFYAINFVIFRTDGKSFTVIETIEDVPTFRLQKIMDLFSRHQNYLKGKLKYMGLDTVYRIIPVKQNKKKEQLDIGRVLTVYKALLTGATIEVRTLFGYAVEALDKGLKQLAKDKIDNYDNLNLSWYKGNEDFFIKDVIFRYLVFLQVCQELNILDDQVFYQNKEVNNSMAQSTGGSQMDIMVAQMESFLDRQGFTREASALFYLGTLIRRVAIAQYKKEHKTKPILKKITFQGMSVRDVVRLYEDVVEKLRQYDKLTLFAETLMSRFHECFGKISKEWPLTEEENVFYIMAGYAYLVANKAPDLSDQEEESMNDDGNEVNQDA